MSLPTKLLRFIALCLGALFIFSCKSNSDDSIKEIPHKFTIKVNGENHPIQDYYSFVNADSHLIISTFSEKIPVKGAESEVEEVYTKRNIKIDLFKFQEGDFALNNIDASFQVDTMFYSYSTTPYKTKTFNPNVDSLDIENTFVYLKDIRTGYDIITGEFKLHRFSVIAPGDTTVIIDIDGNFVNIPYTTY